MVVYPVKPDAMWTYKEEAHSRVLTVRPPASGKVSAGFTKDIRAKVYVTSSLSKLWDFLHKPERNCPPCRHNWANPERGTLEIEEAKGPWRQNMIDLLTSESQPSPGRQGLCTISSDHFLSVSP